MCPRLEEVVASAVEGEAAAWPGIAAVAAAAGTRWAALPLVPARHIDSEWPGRAEHHTDPETEAVLGIHRLQGIPSPGAVVGLEEVAVETMAVAAGHSLFAAAFDNQVGSLLAAGPCSRTSERRVWKSQKWVIKEPGLTVYVDLELLATKGGALQPRLREFTRSRIQLGLDSEHLASWQDKHFHNLIYVRLCGRAGWKKGNNIGESSSESPVVTSY